MHEKTADTKMSAVFLFFTNPNKINNLESILGKT